MPPRDSESRHLEGQGRGQIDHRVGTPAVTAPPPRQQARRGNNHMTNSSIVKRTMGAIALTGAVIGVPLGLSTGTASAASGDWDAVAACESSGNWGADTGNGFSGGLQFTDSTWAANGGSGSPANASREEQIRVAENVLATQGPGAWPVCGQYL
ncbi:secreted protein [Rhodococcus opacus PD630]|nr:secreted protein [Rhodococcus opacus PD630]